MRQQTKLIAEAAVNVLATGAILVLLYYCVSFGIFVLRHVLGVS